MHKVLLPVDGSASAFQATLYIIDFIKIHGPIEVHVVNVQPKIPESLIHGVEKEPTNEQMAMDAHLAMKPVFHALNEEGIAFQAHIKHGDVGETLVTLADELACDHIVMGTRGLGAIMEIMLGSVTKKVLHLANIPVICIKSDTHYRWIVESLNRRVRDVMTTLVVAAAPVTDIRRIAAVMLDHGVDGASIIIDNGHRSAAELMALS